MDELTGRVVWDTDEDDWDLSRQVVNGRCDRRPKVIVYCANETDIVNAINWARANDTKVSIRSGGHSYEGYSVSNGGLVIDVRTMAGIAVSPDGMTATIQPGAMLLDVYEALFSVGLTISAGSCATVAIGGLLLGGGVGLLSRWLGLACDNLVGLEMVTADGALINVNENEHVDLFWASRGGGGGNFGVVTSMTVRTYPIADVTIFGADWQWVDAAAVIRQWQKWAPTIDDRLTSILTLSKSPATQDTPGKFSVRVVGQFIGPVDELHTITRKLLHGAHPIDITYHSMNFIDAVKSFAGIKVVPRPVRPHDATAFMVHQHPLHGRFKNSSAYTTKALSDQGIVELLTHMESAPNVSCVVQFDAFGGAINRMPVEETAFVHRKNVKYSVQYQTYWNDEELDGQSIEWIKDVRTAMSQYFSPTAYVNYCDADISDWEKEYFGKHYARLQQVKAQYDANDLFSFEQGIKP